MSDLAATPQWPGSAESLFLLLGRGHTGWGQNFGAQTTLRELGFVEPPNKQIAPYIPPIAPVLEELGIGGSALAVLRNICSVSSDGQLLSPPRAIINLVCLTTARWHNLAEMTPERFIEIVRYRGHGVLQPWLNPNVISADPQVIQAALPFLEATTQQYEGCTLTVRPIRPHDVGSAFRMSTGEAYLQRDDHGEHHLVACERFDYARGLITPQGGDAVSMSRCWQILAIDGEWV